MNFRDQHPIILASRSPRRQQLLTQIGVNFELLDIEIDESVILEEKPVDYVCRMAKSKAESAWQYLSSKQQQVNQTAILSADTSVVLGNNILGKPENLLDAKNMLGLLSDNTHQVITCVALIDNQNINLKTSITDVSFAKLNQSQINDYCESGEGIDKAGSYAIQGAAAQFVKSIHGSYSGVVGLPLYETSLLLQAYYAERLLLEKNKNY